ACKKSPDGSGESYAPGPGDEAFQELCKRIFIENVTVDTMTYHSYVKDPAVTDGIKPAEVSLGHITEEENAKFLKMTQDQLADLEKIDRSTLSEPMQLDYDVLKYRLELDIESYDYPYYNELLGPNNGVPANIPSSFFDYRILSEEDVEEYLILLDDIDRYFDEVIEYEKERSKRGLFMNDTLVDQALEKYRGFIEDPENNVFITVFEGHLRESLPDLSEEKIAEYVARNKEIVLGSVIPAYEKVIKTLEELKGTGKNNGGLANFKDGKGYYEYLVKEYSSSSKTPDELFDYMQNRLDDVIQDIYSVMGSDPDVYNRYMNVSIPYDDPKELLDFLRQKTKETMPQLIDTDYTLKYVDKSLQDTNTMAYYIVPPVDYYKDNIIYINPAYNDDLSDNFTTYAHEGYPGHLYQMTYYLASNPQPVRYTLNFLGYIEGWANTAMLKAAYWFDEIDDNVARVMGDETMYNYGIICLIDYYVNYKGMDVDALMEQFGSLGVSREGMEEIYCYVVEAPASYYSYGAGALQWLEIYDRLEESLGDSFDINDFYTYILPKGPCTFEKLNELVDQYIESKSSASKKAA
ncbi:MAG: DUF885 domain-containing protein, partial [Lachnospiraceae bacterium]|nr:DUF885 domain-containing protein [Lachnospiraceae bacterium]